MVKYVHVWDQYFFFKRAGILDPWIWLAKFSHVPGPAFYDTAHGPDFSPL